MKYLILFLALLLPVPSNAAIYALGDSFSNPGYGATSGHAYLQVLANQLGQSITNYGINGGQTADQTANLCSITIGAADAGVVELGFNDMWYYGNDLNKIGYFRAGYQSILAYLATPSKQLGKNTPSVGQWVNTPSFGIGKKTTNPGDTITFTVSGTTVYFGTIQFSGIDGSYSVTIDGVSKGTFQTNAPGMNTHLQMPCGQKVLRFAGLSSGSHSVLITAISGNVFAEWCSGNTQANKPLVYALNITHCTAAGYAYDANTPINDTVHDTYNATISSAVQDLVSDGLNVVLVDDAALNIPSEDTYSDGVHPNDTGHCKIALKLYHAMTGSL